MALGIGTMSSLLAPVASAATPQYTASTTKVYMAPAGACSNSNDGSSASKAVCSFPQASKVMEKKFDQGARGDFELRLVTNKGAFKTQPGEADKNHTLSFAPPAGSKLSVLPDWYTNDAAANKVSSTKYPTFLGSVSYSNLKTGQENNIGLRVDSSVNRGGRMEFKYLNFQNLTNGLVMAPKVKFDDKDDNNAKSRDTMKGVVHGTQAAYNNTLFQNLNFINIGDQYAAGYMNKDGKRVSSTSSGNGALRFWNTSNTKVINNYFNNVRNKNNKGLGHTIYAYMSNDAIVKGNTFRHGTGSSVHSRMSTGWTVSNNKFDWNDGADISTWYRSSKYDKDGRYAECRGDFPKFSNNKSNKWFNWGSLFGTNHKYSEYGPSQQSYCASSNRVFAPVQMNIKQTATDTFSVNWSAAKSNGGKIVKYHILLGTKEATATDTVVSGNTLSTTITPAMLKKAGISGDKGWIAIQAEDSKGNLSQRTMLRAQLTVDNGSKVWKVANVASFDEPTKFSGKLAS